MKKIPTIFKRNPENMRELLDEQHPDCQWVFEMEGTATRKYDGTCVKIENGKYFKRREVKKNKKAPVGFIEVEMDKNTGKRVGWIEVDSKDNSDKWHREALLANMREGTYELVGPKIQGNPENHSVHTLIRHSEAEKLFDVPVTFEGLFKWFRHKNIEGIVFCHPDGRMGKIKKKDFGLGRKD